jgi:hypothetical protein
MRPDDENRLLFERAVAEFAPGWMVTDGLHELSVRDPDHWLSGSGSFGATLRHRLSGALKVLGHRHGPVPGVECFRGVSYRVLDAYRERTTDPMLRFLQEIGVAAPGAHPARVAPRRAPSRPGPAPPGPSIERGAPARPGPAAPGARAEPASPPSAERGAPPRPGPASRAAPAASADVSTKPSVSRDPGPAHPGVPAGTSAPAGAGPPPAARRGAPPAAAGPPPARVRAPMTLDFDVVAPRVAPLQPAPVGRRESGASRTPAAARASAASRRARPSSTSGLRTLLASSPGLVKRLLGRGRRPSAAPAARGRVLTGATPVLDLPGVRPALSVRGDTVRLVLTFASGEGTVVFEISRVVHAEFAGQHGERALASILAAYGIDPA